MKNHEQDQSHSEEPTAAPTQLIGRRAFIVSAAAAVSGAAFWALRKTTLLEPQPVDAASLPANVTIVEFAANGKKTGKVTVPRIVKSDADWQHQLSPISYQVTRRRRHGARLLRRHMEPARQRHLPLHLLRHGPLQLGNKIRIRHRLAQLLAAHRPRECGRIHRLNPGHGPHRRLMPPLRRAPGPRLQRRPAPHRPPLLPELRRPALCEAGLSGISYPNFRSERRNSAQFQKGGSKIRPCPVAPTTESPGISSKLLAKNHGVGRCIRCYQSSTLL